MDWDRAARWYRLQHPLEQAALDRAVQLVPWPDGARVLDAGTGDGAMLAALDRAGISTGPVVAVDRSRAMLDRSPPRARTTFVEGDITALPFDAGHFDVALAGYLLHLLERDELAHGLRELHRVLRPGGWLVTVTPYAGNARIGAAWRAVARALEDTPARALGGLRPLDPEPALRASGFEPVRGAIVTRGYPSLCVLSARA